MPIISQNSICANNARMPLELNRSVSVNNGDKLKKNCGLPFKKRYIYGVGNDLVNTHQDSDIGIKRRSIVTSINSDQCQAFHSHADSKNAKPLQAKAADNKETCDSMPMDFSLPDRIRAVRRLKSSRIGSIIEAIWAKAFDKDCEDTILPLDLRGGKNCAGTEEEPKRLNDGLLFNEQVPSANEPNDSTSSNAFAILDKLGSQANMVKSSILPSVDPWLCAIFSDLLARQQQLIAVSFLQQHSSADQRGVVRGIKKSELETSPIKRLCFAKDPNDVLNNCNADSTLDQSPSTTIMSSTPSPGSLTDGLATTLDQESPSSPAATFRIADPEFASTSESVCGRYTINPVTGNRVRRTYKNMTIERRMEANARERDRVHTISTAFDELRKAIPTQKGTDQKLSKLSILRIACSYILLLAALNGKDYSAGHQSYTIRECFDMVSETLNIETKYKK